jgi:thymidylate kinase
VLNQWHRAGILYCLMRYQPGEQSAKDVDVLIAESSVERCRQWLDEHGFVDGSSGTPFKMAMLRYQRGQVLCFDVHWEAVQYGIVYMDARMMLERRVQSDGLFQLSPEDELMHVVLHNFLRKGRLRPAAIQRIRNLLNAPFDRGYLEDHLGAFGLRSAFDAAVACVTRGDAALQREARVRRRVKWGALRARPGNILRYLAVRLRVGGSARRRGGFVALVGPDGAGKSTIVKALIERARALPGLHLQTTYLGPWGQMQLPLVRWLRRRGITPTVRSFGARPGSFAKGYVFYAALYIELIYRYLASVFFRVRRGQFVVADRYITDLRYLYKERPIQNYAAIRRLLCAWFPKPDLLIVLDNRPEVIVSRKSGLAADQIEVLRHFNRLAARNYRHEIITTNRPPEEIADHMLNRMLALRAGRQASGAR